MRAFVSYPNEQVGVARSVYAFLKSLGVDAWLDKEDLLPGDDWAREIKAAMRASSLVILVCAPETVSRRGVIQREIREALAINQDQPLGHTFLIPLRVADVRLPPELSEKHYIDYFRTGWKTSLARAVKKRFEQIGEIASPNLASYFEEVERAAGVEFKAFKRGFATFEADSDYFTYRSDSEYWQFINAQIVSDIFGSYYEANAFAKASDIQANAVGFKRPMNVTWSRKVQEHFREGELVSLQFDASQFFGGAHGTRGVYTKNYAGIEGGALALRNLVGFSEHALTALRAHCLGEFTRLFDNNANGAEDYMQMVDRMADRWEAYSQWLFSRQGVRLWFSMYSGLPYVAGVFDVPVPWSVLKPHIAEDCVDTAFGRFVASCQ